MRYRPILIFKILSSDYEGAVSIGQKVSNTKMPHKHCDCRHSNRLKQPQNTGFSSLQPNFGTSWKVAWVLYSERCVRVVVTEKFWKNLKLSKYFNKSAPCHTSLPDQLNLDRHSLRPVSKSLENALSSLGFTRTKDNFRNSDSLLNYYHIVFFGTMNKRNKGKNAHWSNLQKNSTKQDFDLLKRGAAALSMEKFQQNFESEQPSLASWAAAFKITTWLCTDCT